MFVLVQMRDTISIHPSQFARDQRDVLTEEIDAKYANKVMATVGLFVCVRTIDDIGDAHVYDGDGSAHTQVVFTMLVFRPFAGEVLVGRVKRCDSSGVFVSVGFFDDIFVPAAKLQQPASFNKDEGLWTWHYAADEEGDEGPSEFVIDLEEDIRVQVTGVKYGKPQVGALSAEVVEDKAASRTAALDAAIANAKNSEDAANAGAGDGVGAGAGAGAGEKRLLTAGGEVTDGSVARKPRKAPYQLSLSMCVLATAADDGLGLVSWWDYGGEEEEGEGGSEGADDAEMATA